MQRINDVLRLLDEVGTCRETDGGEYEFTTGHLSNIVGIEENFEKNLVGDWLKGVRKDSYSSGFVRMRMFSSTSS